MNIDSLIKGGARSRSSSARTIPSCAKAVRRICANYPGGYWRDLEDVRDYPTEFVAELTAGRLSGGADPARNMAAPACRCARPP